MGDNSIYSEITIFIILFLLHFQHVQMINITMCMTFDLIYRLIYLEHHLHFNFHFTGTEKGLNSAGHLNQQNG